MPEGVGIGGAVRKVSATGELATTMAVPGLM